MATDDKPLIAILMAVYEPRMDWLAEQLDSLNAQTYPNLRLIMRDDCSPTVPFEAVAALAEARITAFPHEIARNPRNMGSNATFEALTLEAGEAAYIAYCDQDDIWLPEKLATLQAALQRTGAGLACSDVTPVDENGAVLADSITAIRPRHVFRSGGGLAGELIYRNFVIGCAMLIRREIAQAALPFAGSMVHDHYLAFFCALNHDIAVVDAPLLRYRQHGGNQTGVLAHIETKADYVRYHLMPFCQRVAELSRRFELSELTRAAGWAEARQMNARREPGGMRRLLATGGVNRTTTLFELVMLRIPQPLFHAAVKLIARGKL